MNQQDSRQVQQGKQEQRKSERVQFFQVPRNEDLVPVWVFHRMREDSVLGLLLDISSEGVQVLTDKSIALTDDSYELIAYTDEADRNRHVSIAVLRQWSKPDGTLYVRNGFAFAAGTDASSSIEALMAARSAGQQWLRCEIVVH